MGAGEAHSLEGWAPVIGEDVRLEELVDLAFDYRGDVTLIRRDGRTIVGYLYNRDAEGATPFLQIVEADGRSHTVPYAEVAAIHFTGKDMAAGKSYGAWLRRRAESAATPRA